MLFDIVQRTFSPFKVAATLGRIIFIHLLRVTMIQSLS
nr:MAG TPA: hypothetical protein [Caudoviricetes sp.]